MAGAGSELPTHASLRSARVDLPLTPFAGAESGFSARFRPRLSGLTTHWRSWFVGKTNGRGGLRTRDLRITQVRGSAGLNGADASKAVTAPNLSNPMSAALCPAKPPGLTCLYPDDTL